MTNQFNKSRLYGNMGSVAFFSSPKTHSIMEVETMKKYYIFMEHYCAKLMSICLAIGRAIGNEKIEEIGYIAGSNMIYCICRQMDFEEGLVK